MKTIKEIIRAEPRIGNRSKVPQYLQRLAFAPIILPQLRHFISFIVCYNPSISSRRAGNSVSSDSQILKSAFLNSNPVIVPFSSPFI